MHVCQGLNPGPTGLQSEILATLPNSHTKENTLSSLSNEVKMYKLIAMHVLY